MKRAHRNYYAIDLESLESMREGQRHHQALIFKWTGSLGSFSAELSAGQHDDIDVFVEEGMVIVLSANHRLEYIDVEVWNIDGEYVGDVFLQGEDAAAYLRLTPINAAKRLLDSLN